MHRRSPPGLHLLLLLLAALSMRAFVPAGYMAEADAGGVVEIKLCRSDGVWLIPVERSSEDHERSRDAAPCAFAGLSGPAAPPPDLPELVSPVASSQTFIRVSRLQSTRPAARRLPPARAPPSPA